ncbi:efflux RND transporter periplasmic adaptor subunit [Sphingomonas cavernae]|uniref:Efflux RND transporter periplasmic adaptor subunit n=1 Tax=Sphingomonas cavernae TaxID=2320861 RepID=A0A418WL27_9SPHN|nr:efflux RND transporter periplasmic adaptor subunit [Sphingomonas cavernae]RJF90741.1 efflux RND transporter periplasmic adaptor subunit [Sphingomonas cavernae]
MRTLYLFLAPVALLAGCSNGNGNAGGNRAAPLVKVEAVSSHPFVDRIDAIGTAFANEQVTLAAPVTERLVRVNFTDGGFVHAGQVIATLAQGQESAQLADAGGRAREAQQQLARLQQLKQRGFATNAAVDAQSALASSARAQAAEARASMGDRVIRAPFSGWVSLRTISQGAVVTSGTAIATVSDISQIKLDFAVPETLLASIKQGQTINAVAAAWPDRSFSGQVRSIDPVINPATRAVTVRAVLPNADLSLKPGMLMTVAVESAARTSPAIPELALVGEGDRSFVYVLGAGDKVKRTPVRTGARQNGMVEVVEGLQPGTRVVTEGVVKLADGMQVSLAGSKSVKPTAARK